MPKAYSTRDSELDQEIRKWIEKMGPTDNPDLIQELIVTAFKLAQDNPDRGELKIMNTTIKEMRYTWKVFSPYRRDRKVSVFGSARTPEDSADYRQAEEFCRKMAEKGYMTVTGGGGGIMKAGNQGAGRDRSFAANIRLPFEQASNEHIAGDKKVINYKYFFTRKLAFLKESHAVVCFPGGFGTHDEGFEALTLIQTGKSHLIPVVFAHPPGSEFWTTWEQYVKKQLLPKNLIAQEDTSLYLVTNDVDQACEEILHFYRRYHSSRYVGDYLVVRMQSALTPDEVDELNHEFHDILVPGTRIEETETAPQEASDHGLDHLPRLRMRFVKRKFGRLRQFVNRINSYPLRDSSEFVFAEVGSGGTIPDELIQD